MQKTVTEFLLSASIWVIGADKKAPDRVWFVYIENGKGAGKNEVDSTGNIPCCQCGNSKGYFHDMSLTNVTY